MSEAYSNLQPSVNKTYKLGTYKTAVRSNDKICNCFKARYC